MFSTRRVARQVPCRERPHKTGSIRWKTKVFHKTMPQDASKAKAVKISKLFKKYGIVFEGPIERQNWPSTYTDKFQQIRDIGSLKFENYTKGIHDEVSAKTIIRVEDLVQSASQCLKNLCNEKEWRDQTEVKIFARFDSEVAW